MKVFPEYFDFAQFQLAKEPSHTIKRPYINFGKTVKFGFQEYNTNLKLQCVFWQKLIMHCVNHFGYFEFLKHIRCTVSRARLNTVCRRQSSTSDSASS